MESVPILDVRIGDADRRLDETGQGRERDTLAQSVRLIREQIDSLTLVGRTVENLTGSICDHELLQVGSLGY